MKLKGIVLAVILSLASIMMPFNLYADTISASNIVGVNVVLVGSSLLEHRIEQASPNTYHYYLNQYTYKAVIELDNSYVGVIGARVQGSYYDKGPSQGSTVRTESFNFYRKIYVNGNTAEMTFVITSWISSYDDPIIYRSDGTSPYVTLEDSNVTKFEDIDSIEQIIDLLSDIYLNSNDIEGLSTNQLTELQNIVSNTSLANQYLQTISNLRQYDFPIESFSAVLMTYNFNDNIIDFFQNGYWSYPVFSIPAGNMIIQRYFKPNYDNLIFIFGCNFVPNTNQIGNWLNIQNANIVSLTTISEAIGFRIGKLVLSYTGDSTGYIEISALRNLKIIPIYLQLADYNMISTDFALQFGLSNQLLNDIHIIAQGTNQSNSAASDLESSNDQMADDMDDLATIESGYNQQFNNQLQQIDFSSPLQNNTGILPAANFVITIFNGLINNNPFSVLIIIVCILLIGKKVIGK